MKSSYHNIIIKLMIIGISFLINSIFIKSAQASSVVNSGETSQASENQLNRHAAVVPGVLIVKLKSTASMQSFIKTGHKINENRLNQKLSKIGAINMAKMFKDKQTPPKQNLPDLSRIFKVVLPDDQDPVTAARALSDDPEIEYAEPVYVRQIDNSPNDSLLYQQNYLAQINAFKAWDIQEGDHSVVIAIVDNGTDYHHKDLYANIWKNKSEASGIPGIDDDENGFIDDVYGWDFGDNDPDPLNDANGKHGTHTAGIASAMTNNKHGVASISRNCQFMPIKVSSNNNSQAIVSGYQGIVYAADNGADIISCSWGGDDFSQFEQDIINYAYRKGAIIVSSAGNNNDARPHYPASYQNVISVAAVGPDDIRAEYSSFGPSVDICAPGGTRQEAILSTGPGDRYYNSIGTSMACPVVAGLCALVKCHFPEWSNDQIVRQVLLTADNIDGLNSEYPDMLGQGRINAFRALKESVLSEAKVRLTLFSYEATESNGDNPDKIFARGETVCLSIQIQNCSIGFSNSATATLTTSGIGLELHSPFQGPFIIPPDTTLTFNFDFKINNDAPAQIAEFVFQVNTSENEHFEQSIPVQIGELPLLLVDDDDQPNQGDEYFRDILDKNGILYSFWDTWEHGFPSAQKLMTFPMVIVSCASRGSLNEEERRIIQSYLEHGGNLFISGQDIGYRIFKLENTDESKAFMRDYLHTEYLADERDQQTLVGVAGDVISADLSFTIRYPYPAWADLDHYAEVIKPVNGASALFYYENGRVAAIRYEGDYKLVYNGFCFESVDPDMNSATYSFSTIREELLLKILNWMGGISHDPLQDTEDTYADQEVSVQYSRNNTSLPAMSLFWREKGRSEFQTIPMNGTDGHYTAMIPAPETDAVIEYYLGAKHTYYSWNHPVGAPLNLHTYHVGTDTIKPIVEMTSQIRNRLSSHEKYLVEAVISDNLGVDPNTVFIHYHKKGITKVDSSRLYPTGKTGTFSGEIFSAFSLQDVIEYKVTGRDVSHKGNRGSSVWYSFTIGYEDFENDLSSWQTEPSGWGYEQRYYHNGSKYVSNSPNTYYSANQDVSLNMAYGIDLSKTQQARLVFDTRYDIRKFIDYGYIEVTIDGGKEWQRLDESFTDKTDDWITKNIDLSAFTGPTSKDVRIRFRFISDAKPVNYKQGWFIDNVQIITGTTATDVVEHPAKIKPPQNFVLYHNFPNPFNPTTTIKYDIAKAGHTRLIIYDILGQTIRTLVDSYKKPGQFNVSWNGTNLQGIPVAAGIYFCRFESADYTAVIKLILAR